MRRTNTDTLDHLFLARTHDFYIKNTTYTQKDILELIEKGSKEYQGVKNLLNSVEPTFKHLNSKIEILEKENAKLKAENDSIRKTNVELSKVINKKIPLIDRVIMLVTGKLII